MQITFEFDLTLYRIDRDVYSILDWVGDVGGLNEGLFLFFKMILLFFQFHEFRHFLIERLYHKSDEGSKDSELKVHETSWLRFKLNSCLPTCLLCKICALKREERMFTKARHKFESEIDIVDFLKRIRRLEAFKKE